LIRISKRDAWIRMSKRNALIRISRIACRAQIQPLMHGKDTVLIMCTSCCKRTHAHLRAHPRMYACFIERSWLQYKMHKDAHTYALTHTCTNACMHAPNLTYLRAHTHTHTHTHTHRPKYTHRSKVCPSSGFATPSCLHGRCTGLTLLQRQICRGCLPGKFRQGVQSTARMHEIPWQNYWGCLPGDFLSGYSVTTRMLNN